jgi:hypothetical protein
MKQTSGRGRRPAPAPVCPPSLTAPAPARANPPPPPPDPRVGLQRAAHPKVHPARRGDRPVAALPGAAGGGGGWGLGVGWAARGGGGAAPAEQAHRTSADLRLHALTSASHQPSTPTNTPLRPRPRSWWCGTSSATTSSSSPRPWWVGVGWGVSGPRRHGPRAAGPRVQAAGCARPHAVAPAAPSAAPPLQGCLPIAHPDHMRPDKLGSADLVEEVEVRGRGVPGGDEGARACLGR